MTEIGLTIDGRLARVVLDGPRHNALEVGSMRRLHGVLDQLARSEEVRCVVLSGAGRGFCAGADLDDTDLESDTGRPMLEATAHAVSLLTRMPQPVIAAVRGAAAGAGASLAFAADLVVAEESAYFLLAFTGVGLIPDAGATLTVAATLGRARAMRLALLRERLAATAALAAGFVTEVCPADTFEETVDRWARFVADGPRIANARTKTLINDLCLRDLDNALDRETRQQLPLLRAHDFKEGVAAFKSGREPAFTD